MSVLDEIIDGVRVDLEERQARTSIEDLKHTARQAREALDPMPAFRADGVSVIAEVKRSSPSKGALATITDPAALAAELELVRRRGWAVDAEEVEEGVVCLGAAVRDHRRRAVAAISVAGPAARVRARAGRLGPLVAETAEAISRRLGSG